MIPLATIRLRLQSSNLQGIQRVQGAAQLSVAIERQQFDADAYVTLQEVKAKANTLINRVSQQLTARIGVVQIVREAGSPTGASQGDALELRRDALIAALLGWSPDVPNGYSPMVYAGGKLLDFDGVNLVWADEFETDFLLRSV